MTRFQLFSLEFAACGLILSLSCARSTASEQPYNNHVTFSRQACFELTFNNRDLIWLGDPASPAALVYTKPGARPIATDFYVRTVKEDPNSPARRYLSEARLVSDNDSRKVYAFTKMRETLIGVVDRQGHFSPNDTYKNRELLPAWPLDPAVLSYDAHRNALYYQVEVPGPVISESLDFLPLELVDAGGNSVDGRFSIDFAPVLYAASGK